MPELNHFPILCSFVLLFQYIPLAAPVVMTMEASLTSEAHLPSCSYFNEANDRWGSEGLALNSVTVRSDGGVGTVDVDVSCASFHLSDFTVTTEEVEPIFQPVTLVSSYIMKGTC